MPERIGRRRSWARGADGYWRRHRRAARLVWRRSDNPPRRAGGLPDAPRWHQHSPVPAPVTRSGWPTSPTTASFVLRASGQQPGDAAVPRLVAHGLAAESHMPWPKPGMFDASGEIVRSVTSRTAATALRNASSSSASNASTSSGCTTDGSIRTAR